MESESETSSIEVLKALTSHMTAVASPISGKSESHEPAMAFFDKLVTSGSLNVDQPVEMTAMHGNDFLEQLIVNEENYFALIVLKCLQLCPSVFGNWKCCESDRVWSKPDRLPAVVVLMIFYRFALDHRITKAEVVKWVNKATRGLWTQTGATLEHVLLWWCNTPLACQPVTAAKHLRDWLLNIQYDGKVLRANPAIGKQVSLDFLPRLLSLALFLLPSEFLGEFSSNANGRRFSIRIHRGARNDRLVIAVLGRNVNRARRVHHLGQAVSIGVDCRQPSGRLQVREFGILLDEIPRELVQAIRLRDFEQIK